MDTINNVWQIAAGESGRFYHNIFLKYDIMFMGPGDPGEYEQNTYQKEVDLKNITANKKGQLKNFSKSIKTGDIILLRKGYEVKSIGIIPDGNENGYNWDPTFDDIYGWDLQHTRRVIWQDQDSFVNQLQNIQSKKALFADRKQIPAFSGVDDPKIREPIKELIAQCQNRELKSLPGYLPEPLSIDQIGEELFAKGLPNESVEKVLIAIKRQRRMSRWYAEQGAKSGRPTEHEIVAHMILPLLLALGWSEQLIAIEWNKIDLALFNSTPTKPDSCVLVCEAKGLWQGLQNAREQAIDYVENGKAGKLEKCKKIMLTNGLRIYIYENDGKNWQENPCGYFNVDKIRTNHIAPPNTNAIDTLMALTPAMIVNSHIWEK